MSSGLTSFCLHPGQFTQSGLCHGRRALVGLQRSGRGSGGTQACPKLSVGLLEGVVLVLWPSLWGRVAQLSVRRVHCKLSGSDWTRTASASPTAHMVEEISHLPYPGHLSPLPQSGCRADVG